MDQNLTPGDALVDLGTTLYTVAAVWSANQFGPPPVGVISTPELPLAREVQIPMVVDTDHEVWDIH